MSAELRDVIEALNGAFTDFKSDHTARLDDLEKRFNRPGVFGGSDRRHELSKAIRAYARGDNSELKAMSVGVDSAGGYLVPQFLAPTITARAFESSPVRAFARVVQISNDRFEEPADVEEPGTSWIGETEARPATSTPDVKRLELPAHEQYAMPEVTQQLIEDAVFDVAGWLENKVVDKFLRDEAAAFIAGDGIGKPRGILSYDITDEVDADRAWGTLQYIATGDATGFVTPTTSVSPADALIDTVYSMKAAYRQGARWYLNSATAGIVRKFKDADGRFLWTDSLIEGQPATLIGYPVAFAEDLADVGAGAHPLMFANLMRGYTVVDRVGATLLRDVYTRKPFVRFYVRRRVGGGMHNSEALKVVRIAVS